MISGEAGGRTTPDYDIQDTPETDTITQALAALEKRLAIELKVEHIRDVQLILFSVICGCILCIPSVNLIIIFIYFQCILICFLLCCWHLLS